jgi:hypothetical protein
MPVSTIRPTSDVAGGSANWLRSLGGARYQSLALASASGSDYVYATAGLPQGVVWFAVELNGESIVLGTRRVRAIKVKMDIQNFNDVGHAVKVRTSLRDTATVRNITPPDYLQDSTAGTIDRREGRWHTTNPDGQEWTQGNLNRLQAEFYSYRSLGGTYIRLHTLFVDVDVKDRPTASAVTLANTNTTRPIVSGTFAATEGDPLTRARLKIFTAAQVAASGFNADTTPAIYDSGDQATVSLKLPVGVDLAPGVTYHAYLKGAYTLNAGPFWSAWASASFLLAIEPAGAPVLTMTPDATLRRAVLAYQAQINLLTSDDADVEGTIGNWVNGTGMSLVDRSTAQAGHGTASMRMTATAVANPEARNTGNSGAGAAAVTAGQQVAANGRVRTAVTGRAMRAGIRFHNDAEAQVGSTIYGATVTDTTGAWSTLPTVTAAAPAGATKAYMVVQINATPAASEVHYADQLQLVPGSTVPAWSPGGYYPLSTARIDAWDRSQGMDNLARQELSATRDGIYKRTAADGLATDPANPFQGADSMAWTPSATSSILDFGYALGALVEDFALPAASGLVAVASFYAQASASGSYTLGIETHDGVGGSTGSTSAGVTISATRTRHSIAFTLPAGALHARVTLTNNTGVTGQTIWLSAFQWELREAGSTTVPDPWVPGQGNAPDWQAVRGMAATLFAATSQRFALSDFEVPPGIVRTYRAVVDTTLAGLTSILASTPTAASMATIWLTPSGTWILKDPYFPERNAAVRVTGFDASIDPDVALFHPSGLELPVPFWDSVGGQNASGTIASIGDTEWAKLLPLLAAGSVILLDLPEGGHRYFAITAARWPRAGPLGQIQRVVQLDATNTDKPPDLPAYSGLGFVSIGGGVPPPPPPGVDLAVLSGTTTSGGTATLSGGAAGPTIVERVGAAASSTSAIASGFTTVAGRLLVALVERSGGLATGSLSGITDSAGNTWLLATRGAVSGVSNTRIECWYSPNAASVTQINFAAAAAQPWAWNILEISGMAASPADVFSPDNSSQASGPTVTTPAIATTDPDDLLIAAFHSSATTPTLNAAGWSELAAFNEGSNPGRAAYRIVTATGSYQAAWNITPNQAAGVLTVSFKLA